MINDYYNNKKNDEVLELFNSTRKDFTITKKKIYLNNGSIGPLPLSSIKSITDFCLRYSEEGPDSPDFNSYVEDLKLEVKKRISDLIGSDIDEIIFTQSTTEGINFIVNSLNLSKNDNVLIRDSENEHFSNYLPWIKMSSDKSIKIEKFPYSHGLTGNNLLNEFKNIYEKKQFRIVSTSHIMYNNGSITPVKEMGKILKENNYQCLFAIDGAQSAGLIDIDVKKIGCDFLTFPGFKWLCGPLGVGILYINKNVMKQINPIFVGSGTAEIGNKSLTNNNKKLEYRRTRIEKNQEYLKYNEYPEKFHATFRNIPGLAGLESSLRYILRLGIPEIYYRNKKLSTILREELLSIKEIVLHEAEENSFRSPILSFSFKKNNDDKIDIINSKLYKSGIILAKREIGKRKILRVSPHFYNSEAEILKTADSVKRFVKEEI